MPEQERVSEGSTLSSLGLTVAGKLALLISPNKSKSLNFESQVNKGSNFFFYVEDQKILGNKKSVMDISIGSYLQGYLENDTDGGLESPKFNKIVSHTLKRILTRAATNGPGVLDTLPTIGEEGCPEEIINFEDINLSKKRDIKKPDSRDPLRKEVLKLMSLKSYKKQQSVRRDSNQQHHKETRETKEQIDTDRHFDFQFCACDDVLVVDDDAFNIMAASRLLESLNIPYKTAYNGKQAIEVIENQEKCCSICHKFKLILMDCNMPVMNGYETTKYLREQMNNGTQPYIPIVACTAFVTHFDAK